MKITGKNSGSVDFDGGDAVGLFTSDVGATIRAERSYDLDYVTIAIKEQTFGSEGLGEAIEFFTRLKTALDSGDEYISAE